MRHVGLFILLLAAMGCTGGGGSSAGSGDKNAAANHAAATDHAPVPAPAVADDSATDGPAEPADDEPASEPAVRQDPRELHGQRFEVETVATGLRGPWAMAWLDDGRLIFTQRGGDLCIVEAGAVRRLHHFDQVQRPGGDGNGGSSSDGSGGDGGLMGLAVSPTFSRDGLIYISYTGLDGKTERNIIAKCRLAPDTGDGGPAVTQVRVVLSAVPASETHNSMPLRVGPDGMIWALSGDAGLGDRALPRSELAGKLLRMTSDGQVPRDNPFANSLVWTLGHRHGLGFDWHGATGELYAIEQGAAEPDGLVNNDDGLYVIRKGRTYNAPSAHDGKTAVQYEPPMYTWPDPIGPAGAVFYRGDAFPAWRNRLFVAALDGRSLYCVTISDDDPATVADVTARLLNEFGRLRAVAVGPDGYVYLATDNGEDDRIIRLVPEK